MARLFRTMFHLLPPLLLVLLTITTATDDQPRRPRRRRHKHSPAPSSATPAAAAASSSAVKCVEPSEADLKKRLGKEATQAFTLHESFYQHQAFRAAAREVMLDDFRKRNRGPVDIKRAPLGTSSKRKDCTPVNHSSGEGDFLDTCPITWVLNFDPNRVPKVMVEGQCPPCSFCASMGHSDLKDRSDPGALDMSSCRKVLYYTRVLRKTHSCTLENKSKYIYDPVWEPITVGCACQGGPTRGRSNGPSSSARGQSARSN